MRIKFNKYLPIINIGTLILIILLTLWHLSNLNSTFTTIFLEILTSIIYSIVVSINIICIQEFHRWNISMAGPIFGALGTNCLIHGALLFYIKVPESMLDISIRLIPIILGISFLLISAYLSYKGKIKSPTNVPTSKPWINTWWIWLLLIIVNFNNLAILLTMVIAIMLFPFVIMLYWKFFKGFYKATYWVAFSAVYGNHNRNNT